MQPRGAGVRRSGEIDRSGDANARPDAPAARRDRRPRLRRRRRLRRDVRGLGRRPGRLLGRARASGSTGSSPTPGSRTPRSTTTTSRSSGSRTASSTSRPTASTATSPPAATRPRSSGRATTRTSPSTSATASCTPRSRSSPTSCSTLGVKKGDRVVLYLPMIPQAAYAMLACARIGAIHSIVFAGFSADALRSRIEDSGAKLLITADEAPRGGRRTPLKTNADKALAGLDGVQAAGGEAHRRRRPLGRRPRRLAARGDGDRRGPLRAGGDAAPRTRCSSSTPPARPASPRASCTPPAAISSTPR